MPDPRFRLGQALGGTAAVGRLSEDRVVAIAIRLEGDEAAVARPDRILIATAECEPAQRATRLEVVDPHIGVFTIVGPDHELPAVWRQARVNVRLRRQAERLDLAVATSEGEGLRQGGAERPARQVGEHAGCGHGVLRDAALQR